MTNNYILNIALIASAVYLFIGSQFAIYYLKEIVKDFDRRMLTPTDKFKGIIATFIIVTFKWFAIVYQQNLGKK